MCEFHLREEQNDSIHVAYSYSAETGCWAEYVEVSIGELLF